MIFHVAWPWSWAGVIVEKWQQRRLMWREEGAICSRREVSGYKRWRGCQPSMVTSPLKISHRQGRGRVKEGERDTLISVAPALTLMAASNGTVPAARICFNWIRLFLPPPVLREKNKKSILGSTAWQGHHFRIEVAVRHCHLVTFVRHCTFKPSFFSPSSSFHSFLP